MQRRIYARQQTIAKCKRSVVPTKASSQEQNRGH
jgi:hypothetical protein